VDLHLWAVAVGWDLLASLDSHRHTEPCFFPFFISVLSFLSHLSMDMVLFRIPLPAWFHV
jgi:hypothetical protein